ncbi:unconventional myosin-Va-like [Sitophilus oryzae]|uniref:Unconventional myosin-Va-like n=1 Tax=Sitophilus oryzae TaxID=7048 RepID=A0A6J2XX96_SITOR|nr:unconventional myosin-Va-like [Sitophilus oryzae]
MASVYYLYDDGLHIADDIVQKYSNQDQDVKDNYLAAVIIQRAYRGYVVRKEYKAVRNAAITVQRYVRGWLARYHLPDIVQEYYDKMCLRHYNNMATKIQCNWKGYMVRTEYNIKEIIREKQMSNVEKAEQKIEQKDEADEKKEESNTSNTYLFGSDNKRRDTDMFHKMKILEMLFDRHHLLSTTINKGVLHNNKELAEIEKVLSTFSWKDYMTELKRMYRKFYRKEKNEKYVYRYENKYLQRQEDLLRQRDKTKDVKDCFMVNYSLDNKNRFILKSQLPEEQYEKKIMYLGKYTAQSSNIVRSEDKTKNICDKDFVLTLKKIVRDSKVPPYYADFWYKECIAHTLKEI